MLLHESKSSIEMNDDLKLKMQEVMKMMSFLSLDRIKVPNFNTDWPPEIAQHHPDAELYFSYNLQMIRMEYPMPEGSRSVLFMKPTQFVLNRCFWALTHEVWDRINSMTELSRFLLVEEVMIQYYRLGFVSDFDYYSRSYSLCG